VNCTDLLAKLNDYFDGDIDPALMAEINAHLGTCHHCEIVVSTTRKTVNIYRGNEVYQMPDEIADRIRAAIMDRCRKTGRLPDVDHTIALPEHQAEMMAEAHAKSKH
jgi:anti-sigma factor RsiW